MSNMGGWQLRTNNLLFGVALEAQKISMLESEETDAVMKTRLTAALPAWGTTLSS